MDYTIDKKYYVMRKPELLRKFDEESKNWSSVVVRQYGQKFADTILHEARKEFEALIPQIPYIGGDENRRTDSLVESIRYLAFYQAMKKLSKTAEETGKILYDAILTQVDKQRSEIPPSERQTPEKYMEKRRKGADVSQERRYPGDYVYKFIVGDGKEFDYGYDYTECATLKFYHARGADEFMPFYCYLDFPICRVREIGLTRTMTISEGQKKCNHRFKIGRETKLEWPPPFLKRK